MLKLKFKHKKFFDPQKQLLKVVQGSIKDSSNLLTTYSKVEAPVSTGFLKSSIKNKIGKLKATIKVFAKYGIFVELGTYKMSANPFMRRSVENVKRILPTIISRNFRKYMK